MSQRRRDNKRGLGGDPGLAHRRRVRSVLETMGVSALFDAMPADLRQQIARDGGTEPKLTFGLGFPADRAWRAEIGEAFRTAAFENDFGAPMRVFDCFAVLPSLAGVIRGSAGQPGMPRACEAFFAAAGPEADAWLARHQDAWTAVYDAVVLRLVERARIDERLYHATLSTDRLPTGATRVRLTLHVTAAQTDRVTLDGESRPVHRVGTGHNWNAIEWASWPALTPGGEKLPVYAQSHALRQLRSRIDLPTYAPYLESWLYSSLSSGNIVSREPNGDLLVEYCVDGQRLGYLVVTPLADRVVVRTFLFLTMSPSPEAKALHRQLRLSRGDLSWLRLDELSAFTRSDLRDDLTLRAKLTDCGCGHLFDLIDANATPRPLAADVRRHLRLVA